jgi:hypothetical protein
MRLAPVPLFFAHDPQAAIAYAADSSRTTHGAREAVDACRYLAGLIVGALDSRSKKDLTKRLFTPVARSLGSRATRAEDPRRRRRLLPHPRAARHPRHRLRRRVARSRAVGIREKHILRARRAARGQSRR